MSTKPAPKPPILYVDAASQVVALGLQVGNAPDSTIWRRTEANADVGMFQATEELLHGSTIEVTDLRTIVFCEGPGSLLGVRLAAMMIRTWSILPREHTLQVFAYRSIALLAADLIASGQAPPFRIITDARRHTWNMLAVSGAGVLGEVARVATTDLSDNDSPVFHPREFRTWQPLPDFAQVVSYRPESVAVLGIKSDLLRPVKSPDAFMTEMPTYKTWEPKQQAPSGPSHG